MKKRAAKEPTTLPILPLAVMSHSKRWLIAALAAPAFLSLMSVGLPKRVATTWYVDDSAPGGGGGQSWATAFNTLTRALTFATQGDLIVVAEGTYTPFDTGQRTDSFSVPIGVTIEGGYLGTELPGAPQGSAQNTILSGDILGTPSISDDVYHVVTIFDPTPPGPKTTLRRLTIRDGNANGAYANGLGGGVYTSNATLGSKTPISPTTKLFAAAAPMATEAL